MQEYWTWVSLHMGICLAILAAEILRVPAGILCSTILHFVSFFTQATLRFPKSSRSVCVINVSLKTHGLMTKAVVAERDFEQQRSGIRELRSAGLPGPAHRGSKFLQWVHVSVDRSDRLP